jgi:hypothetical protein
MILLKSLINYRTIEHVKKAIKTNDFGYRNIFNDELPYFGDGMYCFNSIESEVVKPKDICLKILK